MLGKILSQFIFQFGNYILPFLIIPFLINKLSLTVYKDFVIIQTLVVFFAVLINYGLDLFGVRYISNSKNNPKRCKNFIIISLIARCFLFIVATFALIVSLALLTTYNLIFWLLCFLWLSSFVFQFNWYFQGIGDFKRITIYGLVPKLALYPLVFVFVKTDHDAWIYLLLCGVANYITNIGMVFHALHGMRNISFRVNNIYHKTFIFFRRGWYVFVSQASVTLLSYANVFILPFILDAKSFVVFSTADRIVKVLSITTTPVLNVLFPHISQLIHKERIRAFDIISKVTTISLVIFLLCYIIFLAFGYKITNFLFDKISVELYQTLGILLFNVLFVFLNNLYGTQIGLNMGRDKTFSKIIATNGLLSLLLMGVFGNIYGLNGVVITSLLIQISILVSMYYLAVKCGYKFRF
ncbi:oligosaccharide flippase family protein [Enterobacter hormaechei subsp. xiangfangensis]|nr:oligosaccharide flippase family protein [Enterobacter hormaechei subsp. xiangfangensis]MCE1386628.1 oligosaccharide flippase family protein [Enterobacter hormaechei]